MVSDPTAEKLNIIELRQQVNFWKAMYASAREREESLKEELRQAKEALRQQALQIEESGKQMEVLKARLLWMQQQLFGRKSEGAEGSEGGQDPGEACSESATGEERSSGEDSSESPLPSKRPRGQQWGGKGHGRTRCEELPVEEKEHVLPETETRCSRCGQPFCRNGSEDSEEIDWQVRLVRVRHKRVRYRKSCNCPGEPQTMMSPVPPKLIPKGKFSIGFWVNLLLEKYLFQRPLHRVLQVLELEELFVSQGTLTGGLQRLSELVRPLYLRIMERTRQTHHWQMDETRWMVFIEVEGKTGYRWWLWVVVTPETVCYLLEPTRSAEVPKSLLGEDAQGIINADRYSAYKSLGLKILIAFCWSHIRRDFIRVRDGYRKLRSWGEGWVKRIDLLFHLNDKRLEVPLDSEAFQERDKTLRSAVESMKETIAAELGEDDGLHSAQRKALKSLENHWEGATLFVDHPEIPMDNNEPERRLRNPVLGRKNYYGSGSLWSGALAAALFSLFQTLLLNGIDPKKFLLAYFQACAENGGKAPENLDPFLPWTLSKEEKEAWRHPARAP